MVSSSVIVELLGDFLAGTQCVQMLSQTGRLKHGSKQTRKLVSVGQLGDRVWTTWATNVGPLTAGGRYDYERSQRFRAHVLHIEWRLPAGEQHAGWWYCYASRPLEWISGRGIE